MNGEPKSMEADELLQSIRDCLTLDQGDDWTDCVTIGNQIKALKTYFRILIYLERTKKKGEPK